MILMSLANFSVVSLLSLKSIPKSANAGLFLYFSQMSFSMKGISLRHTPHQLAVNCIMMTFPFRSFSCFLVPSGNNNSMFGAFSPTFTIYPLSSCWAFASEQVMISNSVNVRCFIG